jgi:hypothetical protein
VRVMSPSRRGAVIAVALIVAGCGGGPAGAGHPRESVTGAETVEGSGPLLLPDATAPPAGAVGSAEVARQAEAQPASGSTGGVPAIPRRYASALGAQVSASTADRASGRERVRVDDVVTIRLTVDPPKVAHVFWGVKDLGLAPLDIQRPRGSGPLDLVLRAPGYIAHHTRVFTDRNDRLSIHLAQESEGARYFGYRAPETTGKLPPPSSTGIARRALPAAGGTRTRAPLAHGGRGPSRTAPSSNTAGVTPALSEPASTPAATVVPEPSPAATDDEKRDDPAPEP